MNKNISNRLALSMMLSTMCGTDIGNITGNRPAFLKDIDIDKEYDLIMQKKSKLSSRERQIIKNIKEK